MPISSTKSRRGRVAGAIYLCGSWRSRDSPVDPIELRGGSRRTKHSIHPLFVFVAVIGLAKVMEYRGCGSEKTKAVLAQVLLLSCLLLPPVSSVPLSRSVSLGNLETSASSLKVPVQGVVVTTTAEAGNIGEVAARMDIEVNDYPGSSANGRHDPPRSPGRA